MYLMNLSNSNYSLNKFDCNWKNVEEFLKKHRLDGIEIILHEEENLNNMPRNIVKGMHLKYFPTWLDRYYYEEKNEKKIEDDKSNNTLVSIFKNEFNNAKKLGAKYMVYHVSHVTEEHAFTFEFDYSDDEVLSATTNLVNKVFDDDSEMLLLFENLWWPGLTLLDSKKAKRFMDSIKYKNKGIMLDLSHMMITSPSIKTPREASDYIVNKIQDLGEIKDYIKGIHVNLSLPSTYMSQNHKEKYKLISEIIDVKQKYIKTIEHIKKIDWHIPFDDESIRNIIQLIKPEYVVYEVLADEYKQLDEYMRIQNIAIGR
ncbi:TIM barrel protein [Helicovermis profundi]|uniref:TIM barrel protein n=1 Tax=Helicovermis profundi TaxID=3065157 RepID=A0AAU9E2J5_9FIRM|nr:TIM barrel protein [Clostridia bacterium S502]